MKFKVDRRVISLGLKISAVLIENIDNITNSVEYKKWRKEEIERLIDKYKDVDIKNDKIIEAYYELHSKVGIPRRKNLPASENLIKILIKKDDLVKINKVVDIYNIISIDSKLCLGAHDIDKISGDVTLKICDGTERFIPLGCDETKKINPGEYSFVDEDNDVICWSDIRQVDKTKVTEKSKSILYFIIGNEKTSENELTEVAERIIEVTTKYCGGNGSLLMVETI